MFLVLSQGLVVRPLCSCWQTTLGLHELRRAGRLCQRALGVGRHTTARLPTPSSRVLVGDFSPGSLALCGVWLQPVTQKPALHSFRTQHTLEDRLLAHHLQLLVHGPVRSEDPTLTRLYTRRCTCLSSTTLVTRMHPLATTKAVLPPALPPRRQSQQRLTNAAHQSHCQQQPRSLRPPDGWLHTRTRHR